MALSNCVVCKSPLTLPRNIDNINIQPAIFDCPRCGKFQVTSEALEDFLYENGEYKNSYSLGNTQITLTDQYRFALSHHIAKANRGKKAEPFTLEDTFFHKDSELNIFNLTLPNFIRRFNNMILFLGENIFTQDRQDQNQKEKYYLQAIGLIGINSLSENQNNEDMISLIREGIREFYLCNPRRFEVLSKKSPAIDTLDKAFFCLTDTTLTFKGWEKYEELKRQRNDSSYGFFAFQFNQKDEDLKTLLSAFKDEEFLKENSGFEIYNPLDSEPKAGHITVRMVNEIRDARFLVAELSHGNNGAYWEAGYAEGLGKPVFYLCEKDKFDNHTTHFDIKQHQTIVWTDNTIKDDLLKLAAMIKYHFPEGALKAK